MINILDYGAGNLTSVKLAFERLGQQPRILTDASAYEGGRILFPGVGSAASGMAGLKARGFDVLLRDAVRTGQPVLGICLGMQLLLSRSEEDGGTEGLGLIPGECLHFDRTKDPTAKIPHMGWNTLQFVNHPLFDGIEQSAAVYFVHSYFVQPEHSEDVLARTAYCGESFASVLGRGNLCAMQFHPERSGQVGARLLENFLHWNP
jgi:glutamine amidotransferase